MCSKWSNVYVSYRFSIWIKYQTDMQQTYSVRINIEGLCIDDHHYVVHKVISTIATGVDSFNVLDGPKGDVKTFLKELTGFNVTIMIT